MIQSFDEDSTDALLINTLFDTAVEEVLREGIWSSAMKRAKLVANIDAPLFQYNISYALPTDMARLVQVYDADGRIFKTNYWKVEGKALFTNMAEVNITYIHIPTDIQILDALCAKTIVNKLATQLAYPKTENETLVKSLIEEYESIMVQKAKSIDAIENFEESTFGEISWIDSRNYSIG